jgi:L-asparaginase II
MRLLGDAVVLTDAASGFPSAAAGLSAATEDAKKFKRDAMMIEPNIVYGWQCTGNQLYANLRIHDR